MRSASSVCLALGFLLGGVAAIGCADDDPCAAMRSHLADCFGAGAVDDGATCDPAAAEEVVGQSCAELSKAGGKSDGFLCERLGLFCAKPSLFPDPSGHATIYPIVLVHGFNASPENEWGWSPAIIRALQLDGHQVFVARTSPFRGVPDRAAQLAVQLDAALADLHADKVNVVAHSMGGLDVRYLVSRLGYGSRVASVTTISSPHRGTAIADAALGLLPGQLDAAVSALATLFARSFTTADLADADLRAAFESLAEANSAEFNRTTPDVAGVYYQSWAGVSNVLGIANPADEAACTADGGTFVSHDGARDRMEARLVPMAAIAAHGLTLDPNDGMATVASARWGEFHGCVPADHYDEVGQIGDHGVDGRTGFDAVGFYRTLAFDLAARGF